MRLLPLLALLGCSEATGPTPRLEVQSLPTRCWQEFTDHVSGVLNIDTGQVTMGVDSVSARMVCEYQDVRVWVW